MATYEVRGKYLYVRYEGSYELSQLQKLVNEIAERCRAGSIRKVGVDLRDMEGKVSILDRFELGVLAVRALRGIVQRAALVYRPEEINKFAEDVAVNRGGNMRTFADLEAALEWLDVS